MSTNTHTEKSTSKSILFSVAITIIALVLGWGLKNNVEGQVKLIETESLQAMGPADWVVEHAHGPLSDPGSNQYHVFTTLDPLNPGTRFIVSLVPGGMDSNLVTVASFRNLQRAQSLTAYRVLEQTHLSLHDREGYRVSYAFVDASQADQAPVVFHGVDYYFVENEQIVVVTLETDSDLDEALTIFQEFAVTVSTGELR